MSRDRLDDETLAAFLDGTLAPDERERVVRALDEDPDAYAGFLEAARVVAAVAEGEGGSAAEDGRPAASPPPTRPRRWTKSIMVAVPFLAAAGIAGILLRPRAAATPDVIAMMQGTRLASTQGEGSVSTTLGDAWDQPGWSVVRGSEAANATPGTAARIGARMAQLEFAAGAADSSAYRRVQGTLADLLASLEGGGPIAVRLSELPLRDAVARAALARQLRDLTGEVVAFDVGAWLETARLAALSGRTDFLAPDGAAMRTLRALTLALDRAPPAGDWAVILAQLRAVEQPRGDSALTRAHIDTAMAAIPR